jgi:two-component system nitrogen regulation sensor histidine kinase NtrY
MVYRHYSLHLAFRLVVIGAALAAGMWLLLQPGLHSATVLAFGAMAIAAAELWWFVGRTNREIARFLDAARYADYSQRFRLDDLGTGFGELGETFTDILEKNFAQREQHETELRRLRAMIDHIPVPLITVHSDGALTLQNNAARRLFAAAHVTRLADLRQFGAGFHDAVAEAVPGRRELVSFSVDGVDYHLTLAATENIVAGESHRLVSLQDIQSELDSTQTEAWQDLVRVLTHEIMNSMTPVTSLARTAADVVEDLLRKTADDSPLRDELDDLRDAVATVARRSDSLMQFVDGYRQISRLAPPDRKRIAVADLVDSVCLLAAAERPASERIIERRIDPPGLEVFADRDLLEPVLLNILRNAWQATEGQASPRILIAGRLNRRGNVTIDVADNGPGVPADLLRKIFVPFFTTKANGSGVGLALARQVMTAHGGFIRAGSSELGGALFSLTF